MTIGFAYPQEMLDQFVQLDEEATKPPPHRSFADFSLTPGLWQIELDAAWECYRLTVIELEKVQERLAAETKWLQQSDKRATDLHQENLQLRAALLDAGAPAPC